MQDQNDLRTSELMLTIENRLRNSQLSSEFADINKQFEFLQEYVRQGEWEIAVVTLCDYLLENRIPITESEFDEMFDLLRFQGDDYLSRVQLSGYRIAQERL